MTLAVVGIGLVSPMGLTPRDHAFFVRAGAVPPWPSPFLLADDQPIPVGRCPCVPAEAAPGDRLGLLASLALDDVMLSLLEARSRMRMRFFVCTSAPRPGLTKEEIERLERSVAASAPGTRATTKLGAASAFEALRESSEVLQRGDIQAAAVIALDTFASVEALEERERRPPSIWRPAPPMPSEAAAVIVVMTPAQARRSRIPVLATLEYVAVGRGVATDENDEPIDGAALSALLWEAPKKERVVSAFGQHGVDTLRAYEWEMARARNARLFDEACTFVCPESSLGSVGAAAGALNLAYGIAALTHDVLEDPRARKAPFAAWAISRDGARGLAIGKLEP